MIGLSGNKLKVLGREPLVIPDGRENSRYLKTKKKKWVIYFRSFKKWKKNTENWRESSRPPD